MRWPDPKTKSGYRIDRSLPADKDDKVWCPKGEIYYTWGMMMGGRGVQQRSRTAPSRSQLTNSDFLGQIYDMEDETWDICTSPEDLASARDDIAQRLRDLGQEQQDKYDNMPDGLQQGDTGVLLEERAQACESIADELDQVDLDDFEEDLDEDEILEAKDEFRSEKKMDEDAEINEQDARYIEIVNEKMQEKLEGWLDEKRGELGDVSWDYS
jgi:hypothetical protein